MSRTVLFDAHICAVCLYLGDFCSLPEITWNKPKTTVATASVTTTFQMKPAISWTTDDIQDWMYFSAVEHGDGGIETYEGWDIRQMSGERWQDIDGRVLCSMPLSEFMYRDPHHGQLLYRLLHSRSIHERES